MNIKDQQRLAKVLAQADELLNKPGKVGNPISNLDVLEAVLGDIGRVMSNRDPVSLALLVERDSDNQGSKTQAEWDAGNQLTQEELATIRKG